MNICKVCLIKRLASKVADSIAIGSSLTVVSMWQCDNDGHRKVLEAVIKDMDMPL